MKAPEPVSGAARPLVNGIRAALLLALLCGPLVAAEIWAGRQFDLLHPYITGRLDWAETKLWLIERGGCPQVLALGSSVTNRIWTSENVVGQPMALDGRRRPIERVFSFGIDGSRAAMLYGAWREIGDQGCTPAYVAIEVLPGIVNEHQAWLGYYLPLIDASTLWSLPRGFAANVGVDATVLFDLVTWQRLRLYRLRSAFRDALVERAEFRPFSGTRSPPALDGAIVPPSNASLQGDRFEEERVRRRRQEKNGRYRFELSDFEMQVLVQLVEEATAAGSKVVLHTPPVTSLYRELIARWLAAEDGFSRVRDRLVSELRSPGSVAREVPWYWCYEGGGYGPADFADWIHLNRQGGRRYVHRLLAELSPDGASADECVGRL